MKAMIFLVLFALHLSSCSAPDPSACSCAHELLKPVAVQSQDLMESCAQKAERMEEAKKIKWFEEVMECMN